MFSRYILKQYIYLWDFVIQLDLRIGESCSKLLTPGMMCLRLAVLLVSFLVCVLSDRTPCEHQCFPYRIKCHSDCRRDYLSNSFKEKFKACSEKCEWYFNDCDNECECRAINVRERAGCEQICQTHPYLDEWNRRQCMIESCAAVFITFRQLI